MAGCSVQLSDPEVVAVRSTRPHLQQFELPQAKPDGLVCRCNGMGMMERMEIWYRLLGPEGAAFGKCSALGARCIAHAHSVVVVPLGAVVSLSSGTMQRRARYAKLPLPHLTGCVQ